MVWGILHNDAMSCPVSLDAPSGARLIRCARCPGSLPALLLPGVEVTDVLVRVGFPMIETHDVGAHQGCDGDTDEEDECVYVVHRSWWRELNPQPDLYKRPALPLSYTSGEHLGLPGAMGRRLISRRASCW